MGGKEELKPNATFSNNCYLGSASPSLACTPAVQRTSRQPSGFSTPTNSHPHTPGIYGFEKRLS